MKKIIAIILTIVLAVSTVMAFTSCTSYENLPSDKRAARLDKLSEEKMNDATSYDAEITGKTVLKLSGRKTTVTFSGKEQLSINGGNVLHHSELKTTAKAGSVSSSATMLLGYQYDKIYMKRSSGSEVNALYSEMTYEEYLDFLNSSSSDLLFNVDSSAAGEKSSSKRTDGGWSLVFEGFSDNAKREIESVFEAILFGNSIYDARVTVILDENLYYKTLIFEPIFTFDSDVEEFELRIDYTNVNTGLTSIENIPIESYTEVSDVAVLGIIENALHRIPSGKTEQATVEIGQTVYKGSSVYKTSETDVISYGTVDGKFIYDITSDLSYPKKRIEVSYRDGTQTIKTFNSAGDLDDEDTEESNDTEAKEYVRAILDSLQFDLMLVKSVERDDDAPGTYVIKSEVPKAILGTSKVKSTYYDIKATFNDDGKLVTLTSNLTVQYSSGDSLSVSAKCTFDDK